MITVSVRLSVVQIAQAFCELNDEGQAQVLIEIARIAADWRLESHSLGADWQWYLVGRHLRTCACSTPEVIDLVREIARAATEGEQP